MRICPRCDHAFDDDWLTCSFCGIPLSDPIVTPPPVGTPLAVYERPEVPVFVEPVDAETIRKRDMHANRLRHIYFVNFKKRCYWTIELPQSIGKDEFREICKISYDLARLKKCDVNVRIQISTGIGRACLLEICGKEKEYCNYCIVFREYIIRAVDRLGYSYSGLFKCPSKYKGFSDLLKFGYPDE